MINKVILIGNVGNIPEITEINGQKCASFNLATSENYKDKNGEKITSTTWNSIKIWGKLTEIISKYVNKGDLIYIEGKIKNSSWEKDGVKHYKTEIVADTMKMLGGKKENNNSGHKENNQQTQVINDESKLPY